MAKIIFVYNADSGLFNTVTDMAHKILSPSTYECQLCAITHGVLSMHTRWRTFLDGLDHGLIFLHRDEISQYPSLKEIALPAIFIESEESKPPSQLLSAQDIIDCDTVDALVEKMQQALPA